MLLVGNVAAAGLDARPRTRSGSLFLLLFAAVPFAFLLGILRSRLARGSVGGLVVSIGQGMPLRDAIAEALGDPTLELAYRLEEGQRFVDRDGRGFELPEPRLGPRRVDRSSATAGRSARSCTTSRSATSPSSSRASRRRSALALDNERLETELRAQYDFLNTIVDTAPSLLVSIDLDGRDPQPQPGDRGGERLRRPTSDVRGRFFWDVFIDADEREAMIARFRRRRARVRARRVRERVHERARRAPRDRLAQRAARATTTGKVVRIVAGGLDITERKRARGGAARARARASSRRATTSAAGSSATCTTARSSGSSRSRSRSGSRRRRSTSDPAGASELLGRRERRARAGARGAARARARHPPGGAHRPRPRAPRSRRSRRGRRCRSS